MSKEPNEVTIPLDKITDWNGDPNELVELMKQASEAFRPLPTGSEQLIAQELAMAMLSEPLEKIRHVCEATMILTKQEKEKLEMIQDEELIKRIHSLSLVFINHFQTIVFDQFQNEISMVKVSLPFNEKDARLWLEPWSLEYQWDGYIDDNSNFAERFRDISAKYREALNNQKIDDAFLNLRASMMFWLLREGFTVDSFRGLEARFVSYAMPITMVWLKKIMQKISPDSFKEAVMLLGGSRLTQAQRFSRR